MMDLLRLTKAQLIELAVERGLDPAEGPRMNKAKLIAFLEAAPVPTSGGSVADEATEGDAEGETGQPATVAEPSGDSMKGGIVFGSALPPGGFAAELSRRHPVAVSFVLDLNATAGTACQLVDLLCAVWTVLRQCRVRDPRLIRIGLCGLNSHTTTRLRVAVNRAMASEPHGFTRASRLNLLEACMTTLRTRAKDEDEVAFENFIQSLFAEMPTA